jgi:hypothetical protein
VLPYASYLPQLPPIPWVDNDGSLTSKWFGTLFCSPNNGHRQDISACPFRANSQ